MKKILVIEDEKQLLYNISLLLKNEGYDVVTSENGLEALKVLEYNTPDLIISDIMMPYISGLELLQRIKNNPKIKYIPFLFLTAKSDAVSIREGMNLGADDYITKPFSSEDLLKSIKIRLDKSEMINNRIDEIRDSISKYVPHELRTPLVTILGYSELILTEKDSLDKNDLVDMTERISNSAKRLNNRIEKFIQLSEIENFSDSNKEIKSERSFLNNNIVKELILTHYLIKDRKDNFEISIEFTELALSDKILQIILKELLENAVKFSKPGTQIIINGKKSDSSYCLQIKDFGIGMDETQVASISAFRQFNREKYQQEGNGLGLFFVKNILLKNGSEFSIDSKKNEYTIVTIKLPVL
jgi:two-component system, sensor histidine kinase and response regulator